MRVRSKWALLGVLVGSLIALITLPHRWAQTTKPSQVKSVHVSNGIPTARLGPAPQRPVESPQSPNSAATNAHSGRAVVSNVVSTATLPNSRRSQSTKPLDLQTQYALVGNSRVHPSRLLAKLKAGADTAPDAALQSLKLHVERRYATARLVLLDQDMAKIQGETDARARGAQLSAQIKALAESGAFEYVTPDSIIRLDATPNDSAFQDGTLWSLHNTGQENGTPGADIDVVPAWDITAGSTNVIVAIVDTGIRYTHQELVGQMWRNPGEIPANGIDDDGNGYVDDVFGVNTLLQNGDPLDDHSHGTHLAGTIGAAANDGHPHVGIAWNVQLMACKFLDARGEGTDSDAIAAIDYARLQGARVINASWGGLFYEPALADAIAAAGDAGILFVAAAGNDSVDNDFYPHYPAAFDLRNILAVAALDRNDRLAYFSNFGLQSVDVGAPGVEIFSSTAGSDDEYQFFNGTSMAAPHVSGIAALLLSQNPAMSVSELRVRIIQTAIPVSDLMNRSVAGGRASAYRALTAMPDSQLEVTVDSNPARRWLIGRDVTLTVSVNDLAPITNAAVTMQLEDGPATELRNDGVAPDLKASDDVYAVSFQSPDTPGPIHVHFAVSAAGKEPMSRDLTFIVTNGPLNDSFTNRTLIVDNAPAPDQGSGTNGLLRRHAIVTGSNLDATREEGEPLTYRSGGGHTVWWTFTPSDSGVMRVYTGGSTFDTQVGLYTGDVITNLVRVGRNDDAYGGEEPASLVDVTAYAGTSYHIAVDGYLQAQGDISMSLTWRPATPPRIYRQPLSQFALPGKIVHLIVEAFGTEPMHYQWTRNGVELSGATNAAVAIPFTSTNDFGSYRVIVTNLAGAVISEPAQINPAYDSVVSVFTDSRYVNTGEGEIAGARMVQESLWMRGHPVEAFTQFADPNATTNEVLLIPGLDVASLAPELTAAERSALSNFVQAGGILIVQGTYHPGRTSELLNDVFGWSLEEFFARGDPRLDIRATNSIFATAPVLLSTKFATSALWDETLPAGAQRIYATEATRGSEYVGGGSAVAILPYGTGRVVFLGWDWVDAEPLGRNDGGWIEVLELATHAKDPPRPMPKPILRSASFVFNAETPFFEYSFTGYLGQHYTLEASTNLVDWISIGVPIEFPPGSYIFQDFEALPHPQRFYRVRQE
jgi:subtilisin family serine protease